MNGATASPIVILLQKESGRDGATGTELLSAIKEGDAPENLRVLCTCTFMD